MFKFQPVLIVGFTSITLGLLLGCGPSNTPTDQRDEEFEQFILTVEKLGGVHSVFYASPTKSTHQNFSFISIDQSTLEKIPTPSFPFGFTFSGTDLTNSHLKSLVRFKTLDYLNIGYTQIDNTGLRHVGQLTNLLRLSLDETDITDAGLEEIQNLDRLQALSLTNTKISDDGVESLTELENLRQLNLGGTQVTDKGVKYLKEMKDLTHLRLWGTEVTEEAKNDLLKSLPNLVLLQ